MGIGTAVRHQLGWFEVPAANAYRAVFINLRVLAERVATVVPAKRILEVGCGDGCLATKLLRVYPEAEYQGIDIAPTAGRLFRGAPDRAQFNTMSVQDLAAQRPDPFDLVLLVDVVHHVPVGHRDEVLRHSADLVRPGGFLMVKEFARDSSPYYWLTYAADRYVTGDKGVSFLTLPEARTLLSSLEGFDGAAVSRIPPARNNVLFALRREY
jgi:2-polyprenyl-6-hydroxyphenyl methylase/3-demethylubiquinone-9 3-methyltransferase